MESLRAVSNVAKQYTEGLHLSMKVKADEKPLALAMAKMMKNMGIGYKWEANHANDRPDKGQRCANAVFFGSVATVAVPALAIAIGCRELYNIAKEHYKDSEYYAKRNMESI